MSQPIRVGEKVPISLQLVDRDTTKYPRCLIYDNDDNLLTTLDLVHDALGRYVPAANYTMPDELYIVGQYIVYSDSGHTTVDVKYETVQESWAAALNDDDVEAACEAGLTDQGYTTTRAPYLDELAAANIPTDVDTLLARLTAVRAGYLDELGPTNIPADVDTIISTGSTGPWTTADVSLLALEANVQGHAAAALTAYDPPTRAEATADKNAIITEVDANETKLDTIITTGGAGPWTTADVSSLATSAELSALETHGDGAWATAVGFATPADLSSLEAHGDATWSTATGFATPANVTAAQTAIIVEIDANETKIDKLLAVEGIGGACVINHPLRTRTAPGVSQTWTEVAGVYTLTE